MRDFGRSSASNSKETLHDAIFDKMSAEIADKSTGEIIEEIRQ